MLQSSMRTLALILLIFGWRGNLRNMDRFCVKKILTPIIFCSGGCVQTFMECCCEQSCRWKGTYSAWYLAYYLVVAFWNRVVLFPVLLNYLLESATCAGSGQSKAFEEEYQKGWATQTQKCQEMVSLSWHLLQEVVVVCKHYPKYWCHGQFQCAGKKGKRWKRNNSMPSKTNEKRILRSVQMRKRSEPLLR